MVQPLQRKGINMNTILENARTKMNKAMAHLDSELANIRTGRANPNLLASVEVDYYGCPTPVNQIASITVVEGRQLCVKPYDRSSLKNIEKAILAANIGLTPMNDGELIRLNVPALTEETRKELTKKASKVGEEVKVLVRNVRRDANDAIKKNKEFTEDQVKQGNEKVQKVTDEFIKKIDEVVAAKNKDIMSI